MIHTNLPNKAERGRLTFSCQITKPLLVMLFFVAGIHFNLFSQVFPVSSVTSVTPPYPTSLDGFADQSSSKIILQLVVNDVTLVNFPVKLRLVMKSNSVRISTSGSYVTQPFYLNGGETLVLNAADLSQYFHTDNLDFSGYSKSQYLRTGLLPDGIYQISFEVLDYNRNTVISSSIPAFSYLFVNDPPLLNTPKKSKAIEINGQQNIIFNWAFRHSPFSRPGFQPEYQLEMWEIYPDNLDPNMVVRSSQPVFSEKITSTSFQYTNMHPLLIPGRRYAWRVTAADPLNMAPFKENGCSEVWWFRYGVACDAPVLKAGKPGTSFLNVEWETPQLQTDFTLRYKPEQNEDAKWYNLQTSYLSHKIENLRANTGYIVEVSGKCGTQESPVSNQITLRTNVDLEYQCGNSNNMPKIENQNPLLQLQRGNFIKAGDFEVEVYQVEGANGVFNGKGYVLVPMFNFIKLDAELKNVRVNTDFQLIGGSIRTIYNVNNSAMVNISKLLEALSSSTKPEVNHFADIEDVKVINAADAITSVTVSGQTVTVKTADKTYSETINPEKIIAITAPSGEQYVVDGSTKTVYTSAGSNNGTAPKADQLNYVSGDQQAYRVSFTTHPQQAYGFDTPPATPPGSYNSKIIGGNTVYLPWKSVASGGFDKVTATITGPKIDSVFFATESASTVMAAPGLANGEKQLMFTGGGHKDDDELFAWFNIYTGDTVKKQENVLAGAMNVIAYDKKLLKVCLVPVNGSVVPGAGYVQTELNRIYKQAVVSWEVSTLEGGLTVNLPHDNQKKIDNTDADTRMDYTEDMKLVKKAMLDNSAYNSQTLYLFFFDEGTKDIKGYMPFNRQFGFIIKFKQYPDEYLHTIAHELGHGAFRLQHPYEQNDSRMATEDDLMAYSKSERLKKTQWDECHDWDLGLNWFEGEEEGESIGDGLFSCIDKEIANKLKGRIFIDPSGKTIDIQDAIPYAFYDDRELEIKGRLTGYIKGGVLYVTKYYKKGEFGGYGPIGVDLIKAENQPIMVPNATGIKVIINKSTNNYSIEGADFSEKIANTDCGCSLYPMDESKLNNAAKSIYNSYKNKSNLNQIKVKELTSFVNSLEDDIASVALNKLITMTNNSELILKGTDLLNSNLPPTDDKSILSLIRYFEYFKYSYDNFLENACFLARDTIIDYAFYHIDNEKLLKQFNPEQRACILDKLAEGTCKDIKSIIEANNTDAACESFVLRIVETVDPIDYVEFLLKLDERELNYKLTKKLDNSTFGIFGASNYTMYALYIAEMYYEVYKNPNTKRAVTEFDPYIINWSDRFFADNKTIEWNENIHTFIHITDGVMVSADEEEAPGTVDEYHPIEIIFRDYNSTLGLPAGSKITVPAFFLDYLSRAKNNSDLKVAGNVGLSIVMVISGVGEVYYGVGIAKFFGGLIAATGTIDLALYNDDFKNKVKSCFDTPEEADSFIEDWHKISLVINSVAITYSLGLSMPSVTADFNRVFKESELILKESLTAEQFAVMKKVSTQLNTFSELSGELAKGADESLFIGKRIDDLIVPPAGYSFYIRANGKKWIRRIDVADQNTPRLTVKNGEIVRFTGTTDTPQALEFVYHVKSDKFVQNIIDDIEPDFFGRDTRFGQGFYVASEGETAIAEIMHHGGNAGASKVIRFSMDKSQLKILDLTDENIANSWKLNEARSYELTHLSESKIEYYKKFQEIAQKAREQGFNVIKYKSYRNDGGINYVIMGEKDLFNKVLKPQMVMPGLD